MMDIAKVTGGQMYRYYLHQVVIVGDGRRPARKPLRKAQEKAGVPVGRWTGRGLPALGLAAGDEITEAQLRALFGEGRHPHAAQIEADHLAGLRVRHRPEPVFPVPSDTDAGHEDSVRLRRGPRRFPGCELMSLRPAEARHPRDKWRGQSGGRPPGFDEHALTAHSGTALTALAIGAGVRWCRWGFATRRACG
ncbi:relaxase domain-containing protein [Streptomyces sp. NPDC017993]|uniref:relaxase domain-containing protein n=1 Tax=Streptomyces sp. NPDC017993 TaxID=3365027 RepID=UPI0037A0BF1F